MTLESFLRGFAGAISSGSVFIALGIAFLAGIVASAVCPCTLPVGVGVAGVAGNAESRSRKSGFAIATAFFLGIVMNLAVLGAMAARLGVILTESFGRFWTLGMALLSLVGAIIAFAGPRLDVERLTALRRSGLAGAFAYGFVFSLGTSAAPLLVVLAVATGQANTLHGLLFSFAFGAGRGLPFLVVGLFAGALMRLARLSLWRRTIQAASGCALILVSLYYVRAFVGLL